MVVGSRVKRLPVASPGKRDCSRVSSMCVHECASSVGWKQLWYQVPLSAEGCDLSCVRRRSEKRLRKTIRTLRKSINREQFHLHFAGSDYELGKSPSQPAELPGHCVTGQVLIGRKCGKPVFCVYLIAVDRQRWHHSAGCRV